MLRGVPTTRTTFAKLESTSTGLVERLLQYSPAFRKFAKLLTRDDVAQRLTLGDVACMAGVPVDDVLRLASGGDATSPSSEGPTILSYIEGGETAGLPAISDKDSLWLDLRPMLSAGGEPIIDILNAVQDLRPGYDLVVTTPFHPEPLRRLLDYRGFRSMAERLAEDHWRVRFRRVSDARYRASPRG